MPVRQAQCLGREWLAERSGLWESKIGGVDSTPHDPTPRHVPNLVLWLTNSPISPESREMLTVRVMNIVVAGIASVWFSAPTHHDAVIAPRNSAETPHDLTRHRPTSPLHMATLAGCPPR